MWVKLLYLYLETVVWSMCVQVIEVNLNQWRGSGLYTQGGVEVWHGRDAM